MEVEEWKKLCSCHLLWARVPSNLTPINLLPFKNIFKLKLKGFLFRIGVLVNTISDNQIINIFKLVLNYWVWRQYIFENPGIQLFNSTLDVLKLFGKLKHCFNPWTKDAFFHHYWRREMKDRSLNNMWYNLKEDLDLGGRDANDDFNWIAKWSDLEKGRIRVEHEPKFWQPDWIREKPIQPFHNVEEVTSSICPCNITIGRDLIF